MSAAPVTSTAWPPAAERLHQAMQRGAVLQWGPRIGFVLVLPSGRTCKPPLYAVGLLVMELANEPMLSGQVDRRFVLYNGCGHGNCLFLWLGLVGGHNTGKPFLFTTMYTLYYIFT